MKSLTSLGIILLFALESSIIINTCFAGSNGQAAVENWQLPEGKWQVTIYNYQTNSVLNAHCKSKDDDLNEQVLDKRAQFHWRFEMNFWHTTLYWCNFNSSNGHASFQVFWPENSHWLSERCNVKNCIWAAFDDGLFLKNLHSGKFELIHPWKKWSKISLTHFCPRKPIFFFFSFFYFCLLSHVIILQRVVGFHFTKNEVKSPSLILLAFICGIFKSNKRGEIFWEFVVLWMLII